MARWLAWLSPRRGPKCSRQYEAMLSIVLGSEHDCPTGRRIGLLDFRVLDPRRDASNVNQSAAAIARGTEPKPHARNWRRASGILLEAQMRADRQDVSSETTKRCCASEHLEKIEVRAQSRRAHIVAEKKFDHAAKRNARDGSRS
jgi:hypothetical protein